MRQFEYLGIKVIGEPPKTDEHYVNWCPKCGRRLEEGVCEGYGLAYGGGLGWYIWCANPKCDWFYKMLDGEQG